TPEWPMRRLCRESVSHRDSPGDDIRRVAGPNLRCTLCSLRRLRCKVTQCRWRHPKLGMEIDTVHAQSDCDERKMVHGVAAEHLEFAADRRFHEALTYRIAIRVLHPDPDV